MRRLRTVPRTVLSVAALALLMSSGVACKQGVGERCEQNSDCKSGLICKGGLTTTSPQGGMCGPPDVTTGVDAGGDTGTGGDVAEDLVPDQAMGTDVAGDVATPDADDAAAGDAADDSGGDAAGDSAAD